MKEMTLRAVCFMEIVFMAHSGQGAARGALSFRGVLERRLVPARDPWRPSYFHCNRTNCAKSDEFRLIEGPAAVNDSCPEAIDTLMTGFGAEVSTQCRTAAKEKLLWGTCRWKYCQAFNTFGNTVYKGAGQYHGIACRPVLDFNYTLCNSWYRDATDFCNCMCPALGMLVTTEACETSIIGFLLLGRRGEALRAKYYLADYCLIHFCEWIAKLGDPRSRDEDAPAGCLQASLPFQRSQCLELMKTAGENPPYTPCPWETPTTEDFIMQCTDGSTCDVRTQTWACCQRFGYRAKCPKNYPVMCASPLECVGDSDHCCVEVPEFCSTGVRQCTPILATSLPEWVGKVPPGVPAYIGPSTTMDPIAYAAWVSRQTVPPKEPESWGEDVLPYYVWICLSILVLCVCCSCLVTYIFCWRNIVQIMKGRLGPSRFLAIFQQDIVHVYTPEEKPKEYPPLPPKISDEEILAQLANEAACEALELACRKAFVFGRSHLVNVHFSQGYGPVEEVRGLEEAMKAVLERNLQDLGRNPELLQEGGVFVKTFQMETMIVNSMEKAFPILDIDWKSLSAPPVEGKPWKGTTIGNIALCAERNAAWKIIEDLKTDIKTARAGGASHGLCHEAEKLVAGIIARTPELPADRCVLDPEGHGVKLLPQGKQRALWIHTGETYMYDTASQEAGDLEVFELPPDEELGGVSVEPGKPVCANWAKVGKCKLGRRCPWRHCKPLAGDTIREPIMF